MGSLFVPSLKLSYLEQKQKMTPSQVVFASLETNREKNSFHFYLWKNKWLLYKDFHL